MRILSLLLCLLLIFALFGCTVDNRFKDPVTLYYCVETNNHLNSIEVFGSEKREGATFDGDLVGLLNEYFKGPEDDILYNPFPIGSHVTVIKREGNVLTVHLSEHFNALPLEKLSLTLSCLAQTIFKYTSIPVLLILPDGAFIDGSTYKTFTVDSFLFSDEDTAYSPVH